MDERLKNLGGGGYFKELLERIRDIRASEKVFYRQVLEIYATSIDYDPKARSLRPVLQKVQELNNIMPSTVRLPPRSFTTVQMPKRNLWV